MLCRQSQGRNIGRIGRNSLTVVHRQVKGYRIKDDEAHQKELGILINPRRAIVGYNFILRLFTEIDDRRP